MEYTVDWNFVLMCIIGAMHDDDDGCASVDCTIRVFCFHRVVVPQVQTTSIIARERPRASTPNQSRSEHFPITASPQAPRRSLQQQGAVGIEQQRKQTENVHQQPQGHLQVQHAQHKPQQPTIQAQQQENFDFNPRQHENTAKTYVTPFDANQGSEEVDLFGQQPFSTNGKVRAPNRGNSHSPSPPVETDAFGSVPFTVGPRETPFSNKNGPVPSNSPKVDQFGSEPFTCVQTPTRSHKASSQQQSSPIDQFGHTPFLVTENKLFRETESFQCSPSSAGSFSPPSQSSLSASCSEDLLISNRR